MRKTMLPISILINIALICAFLILLTKLGGWNHFIYKLNNRGLAGTYQHRAELLETLTITKDDIVFLGNSITEQCEWSELLQNPNIKNRGIAGDGVVGVLKRLPTIVKAKPKAIFLMIGVNDLFFHDVDYIIENYEAILQQCTSVSPNTKIILQSVLPINGDIKTITINNSSIIALNKAIAKLAQQYGCNYQDLNAHFSNSEGKLKADYSVDGIHINGKGYQLWKELLTKEYGNFSELH